MEILRLATIADFETIKSKYIEIIEKTPDLAKHAQWVWGLHPDDELVRNYIIKNEMYMYMCDDKVAGVVVISNGQPEEYESVEWGIKLKSEEVAVLHLLGVCPDFQKKGIAKKLIEGSIEIAVNSGKKAVRLDTLASNIPAQNMYPKYRFTYRGKQNLYACNTGNIDFLYYEMIL